MQCLFLRMGELDALPFLCVWNTLQHLLLRSSNLFLNNSLWWKQIFLRFTFWVNAGLPKVCGFNSFPFTEVQQTNLFKCKIIYAYHLNESQNTRIFHDWFMKLTAQYCINTNIAVTPYINFFRSCIHVYIFC